MYRLNVDRFLEQIQNDTEKKRLLWKPRELKDNIFELLGIARKVFGIKIKGSPYRVDEQTFAVDYEEVP